MVTATSVTIAAIYYVMNIRISQRNQELILKSQEISVAFARYMEFSGSLTTLPK